MPLTRNSFFFFILIKDFDFESIFKYVLLLKKIREFYHIMILFNSKDQLYEEKNNNFILL